jgi:hypothetical protein
MSGGESMKKNRTLTDLIEITEKHVGIDKTELKATLHIETKSFIPLNNITSELKTEIEQSMRHNIGKALLERVINTMNVEDGFVANFYGEQVHIKITPYLPEGTPFLLIHPKTFFNIIEKNPPYGYQMYSPYGYYINSLEVKK